MTSMLDEFEIFNSTFFYNWFEDELFNHIADFFQHFQQYLHLYCESKLLDLLIIAFIDFVSAWFDDQFRFISLHDFDIALTKAFSFSESATIQSILVSSESSTSQKQQKLKIKSETSKFKKISKAEQTVKSTSTFQNIDIFDSTTYNESEFELYSEVANFLQHFQQCRYQYRKSDLLNLLSNCLCDFASDWFKTQSEFIFLKRFDKIFTKAFSSAEIFSRRVSSRSSNFQLDTLDVISKSIENSLDFEFTFVRVICKLCRQNFNFNKKLYEHIRSHETLKLVKNFYLSINAVNLVCEIEKKSFVTHVSFVFFAKSQNSIFEFATAFRSLILLKRSILSSITLETVSKSMKNISMQCLIASSSSHVSQIFAQKHRYIDVQKKFVVSSHLSIDAVKSACESMKISTINFTLFLFADFDIFNSTRSHQNLERKRFNQIIIFIQHFEQCQHLYCESELLEWVKVILCDFVDIWFENQSNFIFLHDFNIVLTKTFSAISETLVSNTKTILQIESSKTATCRHCDEIFNFKKSLREHKSEQHSKKRVKNFSLENNAAKLLCAIKKKSVVMNSLASFELQTSIATSKQIFESTLIFDVVISQKCTHLSVHTLETVSESKKNKST